jgi:hypothetical protein
MAKDKKDAPQHDLRKGMPSISVPPQNVPLAGGEPFIGVDVGPDLANPSPHTQTPGQATHE